MLKDRLTELDRYRSLDVSLSHFRKDDMKDAGESDTFAVDSNNTRLFLVEKGEASFATSWRENENNREVLAVMKAVEGEFVLFLPGEPFIFRESEGSDVKVWRLV